MKLANAARYFDSVVFADAYNAAITFKGQIKPFDDVLRDAINAERRILDTAADVVIPARRVISTSDRKNWLVGAEHTDYFFGSVLRRKYVLHPASESTALQTFSDVLAGAAGTQVYASRVFLKPLREPRESSLELGLYDVYCSSADTIDPYRLIKLGNRWHLVRIAYPSTAGFAAALCDELLDPLLGTASFISGTYDRATDTRTTTTVSVQALLLRWQSYFSLPVASSVKYERGDDVVILPHAAVTPKAGNQLSIAGITYNILSVADETAHWSCHVRRA